jgi:hypothetical protein
VALIPVLLPAFFFFAFFYSHVMAHGATGDRTNHCVMMGKMTGDTADNRAFQASSLGGQWAGRYHDR